MYLTVVLCAIVLTAVAAFARQDQDILARRVTDRLAQSCGAPRFTATAGSGRATHTETNAEGHYLLASLVIGVHQVISTPLDSSVLRAS